MTKEKINLYETYRKVKQRIKRSSGDQIEIAVSAASAAKLILETPNLTSVNFFREIEKRWLSTANINSVSIANEFESAIRSNNYEIVKAFNSYQTDWNPKTGFLYCFASNDYPGIVKIGATESSIERRVYEYKTRRKLEHLKVVISIKTENPALKEKQIHEILHAHKVFPETIPKSNEWFQITQKFAKEVIRDLT